MTTMVREEVQLYIFIINVKIGPPFSDTDNQCKIYC